jgi:hypothetical protein
MGSNRTPDEKERRAADAAKAMADYRAREAAVDANTGRLRKLRLEKEARETAMPKPAPEPKKRRK